MKPCKKCGAANDNNAKSCKKCESTFNDSLMSTPIPKTNVAPTKNPGYISLSILEIILHFSPIFVSIPVYFIWGWIPALITFIILFVIFTIIHF